MDSLDIKEMESRWQERWRSSAPSGRDAFAGDETAEGQGEAPRPFYCLDMFPYPSLKGFSVNQLRGVVISDVIARYQEARGREVLRPIGWDSFGLSIEEEARESGLAPHQVVEQGIERMREQLRALGTRIDWERELRTSDPAYYRWTQWIFRKLYEKDLASWEETPMKWCSQCRMNLANEELVEGNCVHCGGSVEERRIHQWTVRITRYAERLYQGLRGLKWPQRVKSMQRNWIGRREGFRVLLKASSEFLDHAEELPVFLRHLERIPEATYVVLAPEHPLVDAICDPLYQQDVLAHRELVVRRTERERLASSGAPPEGCPTGGYALNPMTLRPMPIWVSGFVLPSIRFGAILGTPGHDSRHLAFARQFGLPTRAGSIPNKRGRRRRGRGGRGERRGGGPGSGSAADLRRRIRSTLEARNVLEAHVDYNLRDWIFARQRYWGEPIPMVHCDACGVVPVAEADLPVPTPLLDEIPMVDEGKSPLAKVESFVRSTCPSCGGEARRETDTMPQWIASCWYYLRYLDPDLRERLFDEEAGRKWLPVNLCVGGIEHAILHLLYVRFFSYFFHDLGITSREEPFRRLFNQGRIYRKSPSEQMRRVAVHRGDRIEAQPYLEKHGSDVLRLHLLFLGPPEADVVWNEGGMKGCARLLKRAHEVVLARKDQGRFVSRRALVEKHRLIRRVTRAIRTFRMNKAVSAFMEFVNELRGNRLSLEEVDRSTLRTFIILLAPFTPHLAAELWEHLGEPGSVFEQRWPEYSEELLKPLEVEIGIFVNARLCDRLKVEGEVSKSELLERVMGLEKVKMLVGEKRPDRVIVVPSRLVKLVYAAPVAVGMEPEPSPPVGSPRREEPGASG